MTERLNTSFRMEIETVTPLHIGSGQSLVSGYDLVAPRGSRVTYRVNESALLEGKLTAFEQSGDRQRAGRLLAGAPPIDLLDPADYRDHREYFAYTMSGALPPADAPVKEFIRGALEGVYLPGSSLKGALRSVLLWREFQRGGSRPNLRDLGRSRVYAASGLERPVFGRDPNHDWLRTLQVGDCHSGQHDPLTLRLAGVFRSHAPDRRSVPIWLEAVGAGVMFDGVLSVDTFGLRDARARRALGWEGREIWFEDLLPAARDHAASRIASELAFFSQHRLGALVGEYERLQTICAGLEPNECLLRVGFGGGWEGKTLGYGLLNQSDRGFEQLIASFRMSRNHVRQAGDPYPLTRTLLREGNAFVAPLGWIKLCLVGYAAGEQAGSTRRTGSEGQVAEGGGPGEGDQRPPTPEPPHEETGPEAQITQGIPELEREETVYVGTVTAPANRGQKVGRVRIEGRIGPAGEVLTSGRAGREASLPVRALVRPLAAVQAGDRVRFLLSVSRAGNLMAEEVAPYEAQD